MFEKKVNTKEAPKQAKIEVHKEKKPVKGASILKIVLVPLLITAVLVAAIYLIMDKMTEREKRSLYLSGTPPATISGAI